MKKIILLFLIVLIISCSSPRINKAPLHSPITREEAIMIAEEAWKKTYTYSDNDYKEWYPYFTELKKGVWFIEININANRKMDEMMVGGGPAIEINAKDGKILKIYQTE